MMSDFTAVLPKQVEQDLKTVARYPVLLPVGTLLTSGLTNTALQLCGETVSDDMTLGLTLAAGMTYALIHAIKARRATSRLIDFSFSEQVERAQKLKERAKKQQNEPALAELDLMDVFIDHKKDLATGSTTKYFAKTLALAAFQSVSVYLGGVVLPDLFTNGIVWNSHADQMKLFLSIAPTPISLIFTHKAAADLRDEVQRHLPPIQTSRENDDQSTTGTPRYAKSTPNPTLAAPVKLIQANSPEV